MHCWVMHFGFGNVDMKILFQKGNLEINETRNKKDPLEIASQTNAS